MTKRTVAVLLAGSGLLLLGSGIFIYGLLVDSDHEAVIGLAWMTLGILAIKEDRK